MTTQETAAPITVVLVDDHPAMREGLRTAINKQADMRVVGDAATLHETLTLLKKRSPDLLVLDLNLPDGNGWALMEQLRMLKLLPPTLVLSVCDEVVYARRLLKAGARGYLMKDEPLDRVIEAIREIHAGRLAASAALTSQLMAEALDQGKMAESPDSAPEARDLSDRELQVFSLLGRNMTNKEVAHHLKLSEKTVSTYKTRLMTKLGVNTTPELVAFYQSWQLPPG
jgi:DNA-binding NarL/FixJ family response regulator